MAQVCHLWWFVVHLSDWQDLDLLANVPDNDGTSTTTSVDDRTAHEVPLEGKDSQSE
jgi:hypothetical protein